MKLRLGLIGLGAWGRRYAETIGRRDDCEIVAFARSSSTAGGIDGVTRYDSWQELVALGEAGALDGVVVATTPDHQSAVAHHAALLTVPVLVEKPLGLSAQAAARVRDAQASVARPAPLLVDAVHLFSPAYQALKSLVLAEGGAMQVRGIGSQGSGPGPFRSWSPLYDYGAHDLSLCLDLMGSNARFVLHGANKREPSEVPGGTIYQADFSLDQARAQIAVGNGTPSKKRLFEVTLTSGRTLVYDDTQPLAGKLLVAGSAVPLAPTLPLDAALSEFVAQVRLWREGRFSAPAARASVELAVRVLEILDAVNSLAGSAGPQNTAV